METETPISSDTSKLRAACAALRSTSPTPGDIDVVAIEVSRLFRTPTLPVDIGGTFLDLCSSSQLADASTENRGIALDVLERSLLIISAADSYRIERLQIGGVELDVHNSELRTILKPSYTPEDIDRINELLRGQGTFSVRVDSKTGLVRTSEVDENPAMGARQWITDSVMCGYWQRRVDPDGWRRNLLVNAAFIGSPSCRDVVSRVVSDPTWYRERRADGSFDEMRGIPHIFLPGSVDLDAETGVPVASRISPDGSWFNQKRLESHALLLDAVVQNILSERGRAGEEGRRWGFRHADLTPHAVAILGDAIATLCVYLVEINRDPAGNGFDFAAPSASSWEERSYEGGMTSDTAFAVMALESMRELLSSDAHSEVRTAIGQSEFGVRVPNLVELAEAIAAGRRRVHQQIVQRLSDGLPAMQSDERGSDTSLTFLMASGYRLDPDPIRNATLYLSLLAQLEKDLLRPHGMIRFAPHAVSQNGQTYELVDSYLGIGYWLPESVRSVLLNTGAPLEVASFGSSDNSSIEAMLSRQKNTLPGREAGWCLGVSATLQGLAWLLSDVKTNPAAIRQGAAAAPIIATLKEKVCEYVSRNLALISGSAPDGKPWTKSNGHPAKPWQVFEAYEFVPTYTLGAVRILPGAHPLAWGMSQLFDGLARARSALA